MASTFTSGTSKKFSDQEDEIEKLHTQIKELQERENQLLAGTVRVLFQA